MRALVRVIDSISDWTGKVSSWVLCTFLVLVVCYDVVARYVFNAPVIWGYDLTWMAGTAIVALGLAYTYRHGGHVRIDVFYSRLSSRGRAIIDTFGSLLAFFPFILMMLYRSADWVWYAWSTGEELQTTFWYPPAGPIRTILFLGLLLFALQGVAEFIRSSYLLLKRKRYD